MVKYEGHKVKVNATVQITVESGQFVFNLRTFLVFLEIPSPDSVKLDRLSQNLA